MKSTQKLVGSSVTAFIIAGGGAAMTALSDGGSMSKNMIIVSIITGLIAAAKDWRTYSAHSPKEV